MSNIKQITRILAMGRASDGLLRPLAVDELGRIIAITTPETILFDWYVDSVNGDDGNDGRAPSRAFKTIARLEAAPLAEYDKVGVARNSNFREQLDIAIDNLTVADYGTGSLPVFDASAIAANATFTKTGGRTNVYEITVSPDVDGVTTFINVWENDSFLTLATDVANCDATPGSYYVTSHVVAPLTIYVHASDSSDVRTNNKDYEHGQRRYGER